MVWQALRQRIRAGASGEAGESLAELMVTISILSIAVITIVSAMAAGILLSSRHREQSTANTVLVSAAESIKGQDYDTSCPATAYNPTSGVTVPSGYSVGMSVNYIDDTGATVACSNTVTLQRITVTVNTPTHYVTSVDVVKRNGS
jgi:hypothetical protein